MAELPKTLLHGNEFQIWQGATGTRTQYALLDKCNKQLSLTRGLSIIASSITLQGKCQIP